MLLLVEEPPLNHNNAFFGERKRNAVSEAPVEKCATERPVTTVSAVSQTSYHYLGRQTKTGSNTPKGM